MKNRIIIYAGQYYDAETGLHYNYHRYYDPKLGRYLRADPIGLAGGINPYTYVLNNPINMIDPNGLNPGAYQNVVDFFAGFLDPGPPPPSPGGYAGGITRATLNEVVDFNAVADGTADVALFMWESYYKRHVNPYWETDPSDPYYVNPYKPGEYYLLPARQNAPSQQKADPKPCDSTSEGISGLSFYGAGVDLGY